MTLGVGRIKNHSQTQFSLVVKSIAFGLRYWVLISALPFSGCVTLQKLRTLSELLFFHLGNGVNDSNSSGCCTAGIK